MPHEPLGPSRVLRRSGAGRTLVAGARGRRSCRRWHEAVWQTLDYLAAQPLFGRERRDLKFSGIRSWLVHGFERWVIFYGARNDNIVFYRVVSGTMNLHALGFD